MVQKEDTPHYYYTLADGTPAPSVTTVIDVIHKPFLAPWANRMGLQGVDSTEYANATARVGTLVHAAIAADFSGEPIPQETIEAVDAKGKALARSAYRAYLNWRAAHDVAPLAIEQSLVSESLRVGGTFDLLAEVDGKLEVVDFKTSRYISHSYWVQLSAYRAIAEEHGSMPMAVRVVCVPRGDEKYREEQREDTKAALEVFKAARGLFEAKRRMGWKD